MNLRTAEALVPVKQLSDAKTRLSQVLSSEDRAHLILCMLDDVLRALQKSDLVGDITVLTPDTEVINFAQQHDAMTMRDPPGRDLNSAVQIATNQLMQDESPFSLLILPADVPLVRPGTIDRMVKISEKMEPLVVAAPSRTGGTNALLRFPANVIDVNFGLNSFETHKKEAQVKGIQFVTCRSDDLLLDIDTVTDLDSIANLHGSTATESFLHDIMK